MSTKLDNMKIYIQSCTGRAQSYKFDIQPSTTIEQIKEEYCKRTDSFDDLPLLCIVYNGEELEEDSKTLKDYQIPDDSSLEAIVLGPYRATVGTQRARFLLETDASGPIPKKWSKSPAPAWRRYIRGLSLEGPCTNTECKANGKNVIVRIGCKKFNFSNDRNRSVCPICKQYVEPRTCGFNNCWWRYEGKKQSEPDSGKAPTTEVSEWSKVDDAYHPFDDQINGTAQWRSLIIEAVREKPE